MVQGLAAHLGRLDENLQVALGLLLADVLPEGLGSETVLAFVLPGEGGGYQGFLLHEGFVFGKINAQWFTSLLLILDFTS